MLGQLLDGRYKIIRVLGAGGFGQTFIAEDIKLYNSQCVVKQLKPMSTDPHTLQVARRLFESEAQLLHKLGTHDQIPQLLAHFEENEEFFLVQQFIDGHPVSDELRPGTRLNEVEVISLLENILQPLAFVHQNQVIHRDIKPPNLIRRRSDNKIVLIDFGAVKQVSTQVTTGEGVTRMTVGIGTAGYMPSEQSRGSPRLSSDVYAAGMIGIQALTGLMPHQFQEDIETAEIVWRNTVAVSSALGDIIDRMVRYDFRQRYQSAVEALAAIQQLNSAAVFAPTQVSRPEYTPTLPNTGSQQPLHSPPPPVPPQYRQETPQPSQQPLHSPPPTVPPQYRQETPQPSQQPLYPPPPGIQPQQQQQPLVSPSPETTNKPPIGAGFYFQWIFANIASSILGFIVAYMLQSSMYTGSPDTLRRLVMMAGAGATIGGAQSIVLRQQIPLSEKWWTAGTAFGFFISVFLIQTNPYEAVWWSGPIVGIIQWFILRRYVNQSGWWILANLFGGGIFGIMSGAVLILLLGNKKSLESKKP